jgi:hypothetical protein
MTTFSFAGKTVDLPAVPVSPKSATRDPTAWQFGRYVTVRLVSPMSALRVHTNGRSFPGRQGSAATGAWLLVGDIVQTASELADSRSLPIENPKSMVAFTGTSEANISALSVLNIGLASAKFGGSGGEFQAEFVSGPLIQFSPLKGKHWHGRAGNA